MFYEILKRYLFILFVWRGPGRGIDKLNEILIKYLVVINFEKRMDLMII